jgi:hypothetical protein
MWDGGQKRAEEERGEGGKGRGPGGKGVFREIFLGSLGGKIKLNSHHHHQEQHTE